MKNEMFEQIRKEIKINIAHINNFVMETDKGTKRMRQKFHLSAIKERNSYIEKELIKFKEYQRIVYQELDSYVSKVMPEDKSEFYRTEEKKLDNLLQIISYVETNISLESKLGFAYIFYELSEKAEASLNIIHECILKFIQIMKDAGIILTAESFNYSPFTLLYMTSFFQNFEKDNFDVLMQECFKEVYWECPELIVHIKRNLVYLVRKNYRKLEEYQNKKEIELLEQYHLTKTSIVPTYWERKKNLDTTIAQDEYFNLEKFLNKTKNVDDYIIGAPLRSKSFNQLVFKDTYQDLSSEEQQVFDCETITLKEQLIILKDYYKYESIVKDIVARYQKRSESKTKYDTKIKEIQAEEKVREKLYKEYQKASGIGFLAKKSSIKMGEIKVKFREQINKLESLYSELEELEIDIKLTEVLSDGSSIYDAFIASLSSYSYIEKQIVNKFKETDSEFNLERYLKEYIEFIYDPNSSFLHKITVLLDYNIADIVSEKYALLGINLISDQIAADVIDTEIEVLNVITLINYIKLSHMPIDEMKLICDIKKIDYKLQEEIL